MQNKPYAEAAHQNRDDILSVLKQEFKQSKNILEIGSGTGQHAVYFSSHLKHLSWQPSDKIENLAGIQLWINEYSSPNLNQPIELDVSKPWPHKSYDGVFAANIAHIMHWHQIEAMFAGIGASLTSAGIFCLYGPFNNHGKYTSESNRQFDVWIKERDPYACIRDKVDLDLLAKKHNLMPSQAWQMPANNFILTWTKHQ